MTAQELKDIRKRLKLTQKALADKIGASIYTVRKWEGGQLNISRMAETAIMNLEK